MNVPIESWFIGPQLIGAVFIVMGLIQRYYPPKHINGLYGYRMPSATKNQQTWDEANRYSGTYMYRIGWVMLVMGIIITVSLYQIPMQANLRDGINVMLLIAGSIVPCVMLIISTEKHLQNTFHD
ncbi:SdpI family protein [Mucilaginibacter segetis]|uniref:SdpI family protein n=1 Tax=Mucilaginibacter segetis TaxID=2793071 RepID=A0A934PUE4_9SPHI|nr:SdpI family protein [Mucilaginibacter segetis]MBK0379767.1 SdpI family protein [Mucilaginibacter segetis]